MQWTSPQKPAEAAEQRLINGILDGYFPINSLLPAERDLALQIGVTRPTLREALQRLMRDGWVDIQQGKATRVRDFWQEGNLGVLAAIASHTSNLPGDFINNLLEVRSLLAPAYTAKAVRRHHRALVNYLDSYISLPDDPEIYSRADWALHHWLTTASGNPVFTLILNGFAALYPEIGVKYFSSAAARQHSHQFYLDLTLCSERSDSEAAAKLVDAVMKESMQFWLDSNSGAGER